MNAALTRIVVSQSFILNPIEIFRKLLLRYLMFTFTVLYFYTNSIFNFFSYKITTNWSLSLRGIAVDHEIGDSVHLFIGRHWQNIVQLGRYRERPLTSSGMIYFSLAAFSLIFGCIIYYKEHLEIRVVGLLAFF